MTYSDEIKSIRKKCFLSQEAFARALEVSFSTVNRWELSLIHISEPTRP